MPEPIFESTASSHYLNQYLLYHPVELHLLSGRLDLGLSDLQRLTQLEQMVDFITNLLQGQMFELFVDLLLLQSAVLSGQSGRPLRV